MHDRIQPEVADEPAIEERLADRFTLEELKGLFVSRVKAGWVWDDSTYTLSDPQDETCYFRIDPRTHRLTLSPRLAEQLRQPTADGIG